MFPARRYAIAGTSYGLVSVCLAVCLSVSVSVRSWCSIESSWFWYGTFLSPILDSVKRKFYVGNKGTSLWNFVTNSQLRKFRHGILNVETC